MKSDQPNGAWEVLQYTGTPRSPTPHTCSSPSAHSPPPQSYRGFTSPAPQKPAGPAVGSVLLNTLLIYLWSGCLTLVEKAALLGCWCQVWPPHTCPCICWHCVAESSWILWSSTDTRKAPTQMPYWTLGRQLCDCTCPGYPQPSASKGFNAAHKFVAKCIFVMHGSLKWKKLVSHSGYHGNNTWCFHRAGEPREPHEQSHPCSAEEKPEAPG